MDLLALARIHAHLCGDGMVCIYKSSEKDHRIRAEIAYFNSNEEYIREFQKDMQSVFGVKMTRRLYRRKHHQVKVKSLRIARVLLSISEYHSRVWQIPEIFRKGSPEIKLEWLKAFAKDEGYLPKDRDWIRIKSVNEKGLQQTKEMLDSLNIKSTISGPNCDQTWYLNIKREKALANFVKEASRKWWGAGNAPIARGGFEPPIRGL